MSWVLILQPRLIADRPQWPAIIGGYPTRTAAEDAGRAATEMEWGQYQGFVVIPGAADTPPDGPQ